jgi:histidinol-phosphatase
MKDGEMILGVSNAPALKECLYAEKGFGSYLNGEKIEVSNIKNLNKSYMSFGGLDHFFKKGNFDALMELYKSTHAHRALGDCWSFHLLAEGKIDLMVEADVRIWDIAAMVCIIQEAGGKVTDLLGKKIGINSDSILATNGKLHSQAMKFFRK